MEEIKPPGWGDKYTRELDAQMSLDAVKKAKLVNVMMKLRSFINEPDDDKARALVGQAVDDLLRAVAGR